MRFPIAVTVAAILLAGCVGDSPKAEATPVALEIEVSETEDLLTVVSGNGRWTEVQLAADAALEFSLNDGSRLPVGPSAPKRVSSVGTPIAAEDRILFCAPGAPREAVIELSTPADGHLMAAFSFASVAACS